jgi:hypothetical protein
MEVSLDTVQRLTIKPDSGQNIWVFLEGYGPGRGRLTVIHDGDVWTYYWGAMGSRTPTLETFVPDCHPDYLVRKLSPNTEHWIDDLENLVSDARKTIIESRKEGSLCMSEARVLYDRAEELSEGTLEENISLLYDIYGDEWWFGLPKKENPEYRRLIELFRTVQEGIRKASFIEEKV